MKAYIYMKTGAVKRIPLVHEVREVNADNVDIIYTDLHDDCFKSMRVKTPEVYSISLKED